MIQVQLKLQPRPAQERQLERWLWHLTGVYNWAIRKVEADAKNGLFYSSYSLEETLRGHSVRMGVASDALRGAARTAHEAWSRCFRRISKRPHLKSRRNRLNSIFFPHGGDLKIEGSRARVPGIGRLKFYRQDIPCGPIGMARIIRRSSGWYLCLSVRAEPRLIPHSRDGQVGIDPGFATLVTFSTGEKVEHPRELQRSERRIGQARRGGRMRLAARLYEHQANQRKDRNHKLSRRLVAENALIAWSADRSSAIARAFGKSVASASHFQLRRMLSYKSRAGGRQYVEVSNRYSTMTCSACGARSGPTGYTGLSVRTWQCGCGAIHDRDCNAAVNTLRLGLGTSHEQTGDGLSGIATLKQPGEVQSS